MVLPLMAVSMAVAIESMPASRYSIPCTTSISPTSSGKTTSVGSDGSMAAATASIRSRILLSKASLVQ